MSIFEEKYLSNLYVFRVKSPTCGTEYIKIGKTTSELIHRHTCFAVGNPYTVHVHMTFRFKHKWEAGAHETDLHKKMSDYLVRGEWFIFNEESKKHLLSICYKIIDNHFDIREGLTPLSRILPSIDYPIGESLFEQSKKVKPRKNIKAKSSHQ